MRLTASFILLTFALMIPARAQEPTPSQTAIQIDNVVNHWAQQLESDQKIIADLQKQIEDLKAQQEKK